MTHKHHTHYTHHHRRPFLYNPYEIALLGYSGSGKTTLATHLIKKWTPERHVAYIKHARHSFEMDQLGKDTFQARDSGASMIYVEDPTHRAIIKKSSTESPLAYPELLEADIVFVESYKNLDMPKIILIDQEEKIIKDLEEEKYDRVLLCAGPKPRCPTLSSRFRYFQRDDIEEIVQAIGNQLDRMVKLFPVYGLILTGGKSVRMGRDKATLKIGGAMQSERCFKLLEQHCDSVFISNRTDQAHAIGHEGFPQIHDTFIDLGPTGGILSALKREPRATWFVAACDLPYLDDETLSKLLQKRNPFKMATAYVSERHKGLPEPLCTLYEPKSIYRIMNFVADNIYCPRKMLINSRIELVPLADQKALDNMNAPEDYKVMRG
ncbi:MAG: molybdopterin-guanine dinucleotide biosynthesis protein B [Kiritimatiellae bacterium]|nr:molybdopterin-guanine dinucleotide biosynthesis protein B [Kiritimatiellia bacterium]